KVEQRPVSFLPPLVRVQTVQLQDVRLSVSSQGTVVPRTETVLVSQVVGTVQFVSEQFVPGGFFDEGELLVQLDPRDYEYAIVRLEAEVAQNRVRLEREEEEAAIARSEWRRIGGSREPGPLVLREPQLQEARAFLNASLASLKQAKLNLERTRISAPYPGRVRETNADIGQYIGPGFRIGTIYSVDTAEVRLPVPDSDLAYLDICLDPSSGSFTCPILSVTLTADFAGSTNIWRGSVVRVEGEIDPKTRMVNLVCSVVDPYNRLSGAMRTPLAVGMFVKAEISGRLVEQVAVIDRSVLRDKDTLLVIDPENRLRFRTVSVLKTDALSAIISSGIEDGEQICISPLEAVTEGMQVRILDESAPGEESGEGT
ncbi:MAG: efflux RND transporter periplasmic adaptor subunit, partial [Desulfomonilia bacterium]|nr:efflux RND transporter periplasmic adaptor subunit [Desulfomonilia bacterium]